MIVDPLSYPQNAASTRLTASVANWQVALAFVLGLVSVALHAVSPMLAIWSALALFLLGVPHGAVERHPTRRGRMRRTLPTLGYTALYLVVALLFFCSWLIDARMTLGVFLILSAVHFSASEPVLKSVGPWVVLGSLLVWNTTTLDIFSAITAAELRVAPLPSLAMIAAAISGVALLAEGLRKADLVYASILLALFVCVPPVSAVAIYYFAVHSMREWREVRAQTAETTDRPLSAMARLYAPFSIPVLTGGTAIISATALAYIPLWIATGLGMAIAAPHMAPFEQWVAASRDTSDQPSPG